MLKTPLNIDTLIIGQGLAGSLLAMKLMQQGQKVIIVCDEHALSASRVAAGLFNPITGQRFVLQDQASQIITKARQCYQQLEAQFDQVFFHAKPMLRILKNDHQHQIIKKRQLNSKYKPYLGSFIASSPNICASYGLYEQKQTGYLDINSLLDTLRDYFKRQRSYISQCFEYHELKVTESGVIWRNIHAQRIIFCQGFMDQKNPWFKYLPFQPAKGDILTFTSTSAPPDYIINAGKWLLPLHDGSFKTGATYSHKLSDLNPSSQEKAECLQALQKLFHAPIDVSITQHHTGIRPNSQDKNPFIGFHPDDKNIGIFNGFGSKGSMLIPHYAQVFTHHIDSNTPLPTEADILRIDHKKNISLPAKAPRMALTERVHQSLSPLLCTDTIAIDATTGNGHDILFLAKVIGAEGHIYGFDIQQQAIDNSLIKLKEQQLNEHTTLFCSSHENMRKLIPDSLHGKVNIIMFNLGYLPHTDKTIITQASTTIQALNAATQLIAPLGRISILAYPGHQGGAQETRAIKKWLIQLPTNSFNIIYHEALHPSPHSPLWFEIVRLNPRSDIDIEFKG